jgi:hypothetical protein
MGAFKAFRLTMCQDLHAYDFVFANTPTTYRKVS